MTVDKVLILSSAIIKNADEEILLLERGETKTFQGHWQLPEGKMEEAEKPVEALRREMKEELDLEFDSFELETVTQNELEAKGMKYLAVRLVFSTKLKDGEITLSHEHSDYRWVKVSEVDGMKLLPGTRETIDALWG